MVLTPGTRLGPYEIDALLGAGGMGDVYRARDSRLGRDVAIKVLPAAFNDDRDRLRRFDQGARATAALNHPNILAVFDTGTHENQPFIVSELLEGRTLRGVLADGALPIKTNIEYAVQIAAGLSAAHAKGIVHRDLKPENLFVTRDDVVKILDFGIAKFREPDQFSLGLVLYELLGGQPAFARENPPETMAAIIRDEAEPLQLTVPAPFRWTIERLLAKDPAQRYGETRDLFLELSHLRDHLTETYAIDSARTLRAPADRR